MLFRIARHYAPKDVLVIIQKEFEEWLATKGNLPANMRLATTTMSRAWTGWRDVAALIQVGRTAPSPQSMEQLAEALTGIAIPRTRDGNWYPQGDVAREMADGTYRPAQSDRHPTRLLRLADGAWPRPGLSRTLAERAASTGPRLIRWTCGF